MGAHPSGPVTEPTTTWFWTRVAVIRRPVFERWPSQAFQILCVKELR
jgi:hypothetical protein